jgi:threonine synthase
MWKAFDEIEALGWFKNKARPRMVAVQAAGCAPVVKAFQQGQNFCDFWIGATTIASGLRVPKSFADQLILHDIRASQGTAVAVSDSDILMAQNRLAGMEGIFAKPEAPPPGRVRTPGRGQSSDERIVIFKWAPG